MPRRKNRGGGGRNLSVVTDNVLNRELTPYPIAWVPPQDPPTVRQNPVTAVCLDYNPNCTQGSCKVSVDDIRNALTSSVKVEKPNFVIEHYAAWSSPGPFTVTITDYRSGVTVTDDGDYGRRARVGIWYSKNIQKIFHVAVVDTICVVRVDETDPPPVMRVWLRYWSSGH